MANPYWPGLSGLALHDHAADGGVPILADNLSDSFGDIDITSVSGTNFITNGEFDSTTTGWTIGHSAELSSVADGESGNCLQITENGEDNPAGIQAGAGLVIGKRYRFSFYVKNGTGSSYYASVYCGGVWNGMPAQTDATANWVRHSYYFVALGSDWSAYLYHFATSGDGTTVLFDTVELVREGAGVLSVNGTPVVGAQVEDARVDDTINVAAWDATTAGVLDALRDAMIAHGLITAFTCGAGAVAAASAVTGAGTVT